MKKYFSVDIWNNNNPILLHDTLNEAKKACLHNATEQYDYACEIENILEYERVAHMAIYGVVMGQCVSTTRAADKDCPHEAQYDYIVNSPELVEHNGWIKCSDRLPPIETDILGLCKIESLNIKSPLILIVSREVADGEYYFSPVNQNGLDYESAVEVTHWQPLPPPPKEKE